VPAAQAVLHPKFLVLFAVPVALHFTWNSSFQLPLFGKYLLLGFLAYVVIFSLVQSGLREVKRIASPAQLDFEAIDPTTMMRTVVHTKSAGLASVRAPSEAAAVPSPLASIPPAPGGIDIELDPHQPTGKPH